MKKQALAIAIASALAAPSAFAAQDTAGMHYTSASEGFYASIRLGWRSVTSDDSDAGIGNESSRIGVSGTNDLGGGLEGFYTWEAGANTSGSALGNTRVGHVGLRGDFGQIMVGRFWTNDYNWTYVSTDVANVFSGNFTYGDNRPARQGRAIEYTTPDLNGFQGAIHFTSAGGDDGNDIDTWNLAGKYAVQGFTVAGSYHNRADISGGSQVNSLIRLEGNDALSGDALTMNTKDLRSWTVRLGYAQDNWYVDGWYGQDGVSEFDGTYNNTAFKLNDTEIFSIAGGVTVDKVNLYVVFEQNETGGRNGGTNVSFEDTYGTVGVQYSLGSRSRVWVEYHSRDLDTNKNADDIVGVGLRHDF